jgi:peptidyl-prolyl cis-trans isomerase SurA
MKLAPIVLVTGALFAGAVTSQAELANAIQAIVHDSVITRHEVDLLTEQTADTLVRQYRNQPAALEQKVNEMRSENVEKLLQRQLILHEFKTAGYSLPESVLDDLVQERIKADFGDRAILTKTLDARGITYEKFRQQVRERFIVEQLRMKNISQEIIISPHKVETYYLAHRDEFKVEDEIKIRMIVLDKSMSDAAPDAKQMAEDILRQVEGGAAFGDMATIYSQDAKKSQGGDWGWREKSALRKELADAAANLKPGQHSGVIETEKTCYIMEVEDTRPAHVKPLAEVRQLIEKNLLLEERNRIEKQWIDRLKKKTFVRYF